MEFLAIGNVLGEHLLDSFHTEPSCPLLFFLSRLVLTLSDVDLENYLADDSWCSLDDDLEDHLTLVLERLVTQDRVDYNWDCGNDEGSQVPEGVDVGPPDFLFYCALLEYLHQIHLDQLVENDGQMEDDVQLM